MSKYAPVRLHHKGFRVDHTNGGEFVPLLASNGGWLADIRSGGDFHKEVVVAVNCHDDLLAACKDVLIYLDHNEGSAPNGMRLITAKSVLADAIAKAQGT